MYLSTVTCSQEHLGLVWVVVELGSRVVLISPMGSAQTAYGWALLCSGCPKAEKMAVWE